MSVCVKVSQLDLGSVMCLCEFGACITSVPLCVLHCWTFEQCCWLDMCALGALAGIGCQHCCAVAEGGMHSLRLW